MKAVLVFSLLCFFGIGRADEPATVPAVYRNTPDFYGAIGTGVTVAATIISTTVAVGETTTITLQITKVQNPGDVSRPPLETMPAWTAGFQIEAGEKVIGAREVSFRYLLRPRAVGETAIPRIKFRYFNPSAAEGKQLQTAYTEGLTLMVNSARKSDTTRREIPSRFLTPVTDSPSLVLVHPWQWMISIPVSLLTIPLISWLFHAKSAGQSKLTRSRAGVRATRQLAEAHRSEDPAGIVSQTINEYLSTRPDLNRDEAAALLTACDEARFSPKREQRNSLIHDAGRLIAKWEETA